MSKGSRQQRPVSTVGGGRLTRLTVALLHIPLLLFLVGLSGVFKGCRWKHTQCGTWVGLGGAQLDCYPNLCSGSGLCVCMCERGSLRWKVEQVTWWRCLFDREEDTNLFWYLEMGGDASEEGIAEVKKRGDEGVNRRFSRQVTEAVLDFANVVEVKVGVLMTELTRCSKERVVQDDPKVGWVEESMESMEGEMGPVILRVDLVPIRRSLFCCC